MGSKTSKETLPLLQEQCNEFMVCSDDTYNMFMSIFRNDIRDKYEEDYNDVTIFKHNNRLYKMVYVKTNEYIGKSVVPIIILYNECDRMTWYKALDILNIATGISIFICYNTYDRRRSVSMHDISQLDDKIPHYEIEHDKDKYKILTMVLEKHILNSTEL